MQDLRRNQKKLVIGMVGLPARGKTYISQKMNRYLNWLGYKTQVFSINQVMQKQQGVAFDPEIYDPSNAKAISLTEDYAKIALTELTEFLKNDGEVAIFNATNYTVKSRAFVSDTLQIKLPGAQLFWVESICNNLEVVNKNVKLTKLNCQQYSNLSKEEAQKDFLQKIEQIALRYDGVELSKQSYIKLIDIGQHIMIHEIDGYLQSKIVSFLMNLHIFPRPIYFCRVGQSQDKALHKLGGDSELSQKGIDKAYALADTFQKEFQNMENKNSITIFTSTMKRTVATAEILSKAMQYDNIVSLKALDELNYGLCDGLTHEEIQQKYPENLNGIEKDKDNLRFRYPRGESYLDIISRIEPVIFEIERFQTPVVIVGHLAVLKCLYAYFHQDEIKDIPNIVIPEDVIVKLVPGTYHCKESRIILQEKNPQLIQEEQKEEK